MHCWLRTLVMAQGLYLFVGELGWALLHECLHALLAIGLSWERENNNVYSTVLKYKLRNRTAYRRECGMEGATLELETFLQSCLVGCVDRLLAELHNQTRVGANLLAQFDCLTQQLIGWNNLADQANLFGLLGIDHVAGQAHFHGLRLADNASQALGATSSGNGAQCDLWLTELGLVARINDIAHHCQLTATAEGVTVDSRNDWLLGACHLSPVVQEITLNALGICVGSHLLDVGASGKSLLASSQHNGGNVAILAIALQGSGKFLHQAIAEGIQCLGAIQSDNSNIFLLSSHFSLNEFPVATCSREKEIASTSISDTLRNQCFFFCVYYQTNTQVLNNKQRLKSQLQ